MSTFTEKNILKMPISPYGYDGDGSWYDEDCLPVTDYSPTDPKARDAFQNAVCLLKQQESREAVRKKFGNVIDYGQLQQILGEFSMAADSIIDQLTEYSILMPRPDDKFELMPEEYVRIY